MVKEQSFKQKLHEWVGGSKESLVLAWVQNFWLGFGFGIAGKYLSNPIQTRRLSSLKPTVMVVDKTQK